MVTCIGEKSAYMTGSSIYRTTSQSIAAATIDRSFSPRLFVSSFFMLLHPSFPEPESSCILCLILRLCQLRSHLLLRQIPFQLSLVGCRHAACLLGHHYRQGIRHLADSHSRSVPRPQLLAQEQVIRQGEITGGRDNPVSPDDDSAVVQRCVFLKYI